jgi:hypothetical protein
MKTNMKFDREGAEKAVAELSSLGVKATFEHREGISSSGEEVDFYAVYANGTQIAMGENLSKFARRHKKSVRLASAKSDRADAAYAKFFEEEKMG